MRREIAEVAEAIVKLPKTMIFETAKVDGYVAIEERVATNFYFDIYELSNECLVSGVITEAVIVGVHTMQKLRLKLGLSMTS